MKSDSDRVFADLVKWISQPPAIGGHVHESLEMRGDGSARGLFARARISQGETLVALPESLAVSGSTSPMSYGDRSASSWLRCIAAYYRARQNPERFQQYFDSLPKVYDSLLNWTDDEVAVYLSGTTLCSLVLRDRQDNVLESRYQEAVRPYLEHLGLVSSSDSISEEVAHFREACMCVSTRGFHLEESVRSSLYSGPFLLPFIDLLNHDPTRKCTTLHYVEGQFLMKAERDIEEDEEVCHSYGTKLTSMQVLQTFGFVPESSIDAAERIVRVGDHVTPAILTKLEVVSACQSVIASSFPAEVRTYMESSRSLKCEESWDLELDVSTRDLAFLPDDFVVSCVCPLSEGLITLCCTLFLPPDVYSEFMASGATLLERNMLDDYYLGKLVCKAIDVAIASKVSTYSPVTILGSGMPEQHHHDDFSLLREIRRKPELQRALFGLTVRLEEKSCLAALRSDVQYISHCLGGISLSSNNVEVAVFHCDSTASCEPNSKKAKHALLSS